MPKRNRHPEVVKAMIRMRGTSLSALSDDADMHVSSLAHALRRCIPAANRAIAQFLETSVHDLWPRWFDEDGNRLPDAGRLSSRTRINRRQKRSANTDRENAA